MVVRFFDLPALHETIAEELNSAFARVMARGQFILGDELAMFEQEFAHYCGASYCVGVGNGFDALTLSLRAIGISAGDEVIVPANTFIATWLSVTACGAIPVPVEPEASTHNIDPDRIAAAITSRTRAIVPVHLYGKPADMSRVNRIGEEFNLVVVEDAAQSHGARLGNRACGSLGSAAAFSFYPGKNLGALGDGGAITTDNDQLYQQLLRLRNYGSSEKYQHETLGVNSRLDELQAAFLRVKLAHLDEWNNARRAVAQRYMDRLSHLPDLILPSSDNLANDAWHLFVVRTGKRDQLARTLSNHGIETVIHYPTAPMFQPAFIESFPDAKKDFPLTHQLQQEVLSLPMGPHLTPADIDTVCDRIIDTLSRPD